MGGKKKRKITIQKIKANRVHVRRARKLRKRLQDKPSECCLCGVKIRDGGGHNPAPLKKGGDQRCCDLCNVGVLAARLELLHQSLKQKEKEDREVYFPKTSCIHGEPGYCELCSVGDTQF